MTTTERRLIIARRIIVGAAVVVLCIVGVYAQAADYIASTEDDPRREDW